MIDLNALPPLPTGTAQLRGRTIALRALAASEIAAIIAQMPEREGMEYQKYCHLQRLRRAVAVGASCNIAHADGSGWSPTQTRGWVYGYVAYLTERLSQVELDRLHLAHQTLLEPAEQQGEEGPDTTSGAVA